MSRAVRNDRAGMSVEEQNAVIFVSQQILSVFQFTDRADDLTPVETIVLSCGIASEAVTGRVKFYTLITRSKPKISFAVV